MQRTHRTSASASTYSIRPVAGYKSDKPDDAQQHGVGPKGHRHEGVLLVPRAGAEGCGAAVNVAKLPGVLGAVPCGSQL